MAGRAVVVFKDGEIVWEKPGREHRPGRGAGASFVREGALGGALSCPHGSRAQDPRTGRGGRRLRNGSLIEPA